MASVGLKPPLPAEALQAAHADGTCEPCVLHTSTLGCHKGDRCAYCHLPHPLESSSSTRGVRKHTRDSIRHRVPWFSVAMLSLGRLCGCNSILQPRCIRSLAVFCGVFLATSSLIYAFQLFYGFWSCFCKRGSFSTSDA